MTTRTLVLSHEELDECETVSKQIHAAIASVFDLQDKLWRRGDGDRAAKLHVAVSRLEEARGLVERAFR